MSKRTKRPSAEAAMRQEALGAVAKAAAAPRAGKEDGAGPAEPMPPETGVRERIGYSGFSGC